MIDYIFEELDEAMYDSQQNVINTLLEQNHKEYLLIEQYLMHHSYDEIVQEGDIGIRTWQLLKKTTKAMNGVADHASNLLKGMFNFKRKEKPKGSSKTPNEVASQVVPKKNLPKRMAEAESNLKTPFKGKENVVLSATPIFIKEITEDDSLYIGLIGVNYEKDDEGKLKHVSNSHGIHGLEDNTIVYKNMVYYIKHPDALENLGRIVEQAVGLVDKQEINQKQLRDDIKKAIAKSHKLGAELNAGGTKISMKEFTTFSATINKLTNMMDHFQNANHVISHMDGETIDAMNQLVRELETCQHGLNGLSNEIGKVYMIKAQYVNSITNKNDLAKFVEMCIDAGVPPKFVAYNTWLIANVEIRGDKTDFEKVPMGQTRMVLFPRDKKIITKIAFSGRGLTSNKNEVRMSEFLQRSKEEDMIKASAAIVGKYGKDCAVIDMERIVDRAGKHPTPQMLTTVKNQFKDFTARHPELRLVVTDFNDGNIMWSSDRNCWVCIDYGLGQRDSSSNEKMEKRATKKIEEYKRTNGGDTKITNVIDDGGEKHD